MARFALFALALSVPATLAADPPSRPDKRFLSMDGQLIPLHHKDGRRMLAESTASEAYWQLSQFYAPQPDLGSCGLASCLMVLNALPIDRPPSKNYGPFRLFTADNFFSPDVEAVVTRKKVSASGMTLDQLGRVLSTFPVSVERVYASDSSVDSFRDKMKTALARPDCYVLVNYHRKGLGQESGGHISGLGAYHEKSDMVLILDTANYKYPWTWVKVDRLWNAMSAGVDSESKKTRGFVLVTTKR